MPDRILKLRDLRRILASFGRWEDSSRGKGSHTMFFRTIDERRVSYPLPTRDDILASYVRQLRRRFKLTAEDGVCDDDFYGR